MREKRKEIADWLEVGFGVWTGWLTWWEKPCISLTVTHSKIPAQFPTGCQPDINRTSSGFIFPPLGDKDALIASPPSQKDLSKKKEKEKKKKEKKSLNWILIQSQRNRNHIRKIKIIIKAGRIHNQPATRKKSKIPTGFFRIANIPLDDSQDGIRMGKAEETALQFHQLFFIRLYSSDGIVNTCPLC